MHAILEENYGQDGCFKRVLRIGYVTESRVGVGVVAIDFIVSSRRSSVLVVLASLIYGCL